MSEAQHNAVSLVHTRLYRIGGAVNQSHYKTDDGDVVVDAKLVFSSGPLVDCSNTRYREVGRSAILIGNGGHIKYYKLRLPSLPAYDCSYQDTYIKVFTMAEECSGDFYVAVHLTAGWDGDIFVAWCPHVRPAPAAPGANISPSSFMRFLQELLHQYCERYEYGV